MAALPPIPTSAGTPMDFMSFMKSQGMPDIAGASSAAGAGSGGASLRRMIDELVRTRGRYESEKTTALQFGKQMDMLAKQIGALSEQQHSLLGFHVVRINSMIDDLRKSADTMEREEQSATRDKIAREERDRLHKEMERRARDDREARERREREESERRKRFVREEREARERRERDERDARDARERQRDMERKLQAAAAAASTSPSSGGLPPTSAVSSSSSSSSSSLPAPEDIMPNMDFADMKNFPDFMAFVKQQQQKESQASSSSKRHSIGPTSASVMDASVPAPSRTVSPTSQKRRRSVPTAANATESISVPLSSSGTATTPSASPASKRAKLSPSIALLNRKRVDAEPPRANNDAMSDDEAATAAAALSLASVDASPPLDDALPPELQAQLQAQALAMLQAQLEQQEAEQVDTPADMDTTDDGNPIAPPKELTPPRAPTSQQPSRAQTEPKPAAMAIKAEPATAAVAPAASVAKAEPKPTPKAKPKKKAPVKKEPVQAVEDTTIANPESVPLKNKAIHQWMSQDPERLYTADDIVAAGIRYRQRETRGGLFKGKVYILTNKRDVRNVLDKKKNKQWIHQGNGRWKLIV